MAAWIGLLVTSLNLMPVGQLDGGHGTFAIFGQRAHKIIGRVAFMIVAVVAVLGFVWHGSPSGFIYTVLLAVMLPWKVLRETLPLLEETDPNTRAELVVFPVPRTFSVTSPTPLKWVAVTPDCDVRSTTPPEVTDKARFVGLF